MILINGGRSTRFLIDLYGRKRARVYAGQPAPNTEIKRLDLEIASLTGKAQALSQKLGELYARFRRESRKSPGAEKSQAIMLALSREADDCIDRLYKLEKLRNSLRAATRA